MVELGLGLTWDGGGGVDYGTTGLTIGEDGVGAGGGRGDGGGGVDYATAEVDY